MFRYLSVYFDYHDCIFSTYNKHVTTAYLSSHNWLSTMQVQPLVQKLRTTQFRIKHSVTHRAVMETARRLVKETVTRIITLFNAHLSAASGWILIRSRCVADDCVGGAAFGTSLRLAANRQDRPRPGLSSALSAQPGRRGAIYCKAMSMKVHPITRATRRININEPPTRASAATRRQLVSARPSTALAPPAGPARHYGWKRSERRAGGRE